ncbi:sulfatase-like hydrolase/transferase [Bacillaceae bacterium SIJ1]|uniref:sulfatase-like hydrolase/transferase n=1 Tax=Litoribacterium kuwaitense TaxID=1398745 RepID=UPI0013ED9A4E|nr:sulfatase-like hydrolase/transferase [Litoribacterium kuwaitense]NGP46837.1 sulfatase-like hydrolase/transferase [Litoribacterium kuwaitense]
MSKNKQPNVIVFFTDQQRWDTTGVHGNPLGLTPHFDQMAKTGTHLSRSFTCQPVCGPARSSLQTGLYATETGCYVNGIPLSQDQRTLAHYFKDEGYQTGYIGKWHLASEDPVPAEERGGYDDWLGANALEMCSDAYDTVLYNNDCEEVKLPGYRVDAMTDAAIRYIDERKDNPFFLFLSFLEPHHQNHLDNYPAPDGYEERYTGQWMPPDLAALGGTSHQHLGGYFGMVKKIDEALGRLFDALKSLQLSEDTIVLFTSDHACHFKTRNSEYKRSCHESSIRVPTALTGPGFDGGGHIDELVSLVDLPPTLLDGAGIPVPEEMQGASVLPLTRGENEVWQDDVFVQISESQVGRAIRTKRYKYGVTAADGDQGDHSFAYTYKEEFLYDLHADPYELTNLIQFDSYQHVAEDMKERLLTRIRTVEGREATVEPVEKVRNRQRKVSIR